MAAYTSAQRQQEIAQLLQAQGAVRSAELAQRYEVTRETIRQDLVALEQLGLAQRTHGGALLRGYGLEMPLDFRSDPSHLKEKIARCACAHIQENHSIYLDAGTTALACVPFLNRAEPLDIFTPSLEAAQLLDATRHNVFVLPGKKCHKNESLLGPWTDRFLRTVHIDLALLGTSGLYGSTGPTTHSYAELNLMQVVIDQSDLTYVLAAASKFQEPGLHTYASLESIDALITDDSLAEKTRASLPPILKVLVAGID